MKFRFNNTKPFQFYQTEKSFLGKLRSDFCFTEPKKFGKMSCEMQSYKWCSNQCFMHVIHVERLKTGTNNRQRVRLHKPWFFAYSKLFAFYLSPCIVYFFLLLGFVVWFIGSEYNHVHVHFFFNSEASLARFVTNPNNSNIASYFFFHPFICSCRSSLMILQSSNKVFM
jgi:hypothetical protein